MPTPIAMTPNYAFDAESHAGWCISLANRTPVPEPGWYRVRVSKPGYESTVFYRYHQLGEQCMTFSDINCSQLQPFPCDTQNFALWRHGGRSGGELESQLLLAHKPGHLSDRAAQPVFALHAEVDRMLDALIRKLEQKCKRAQHPSSPFGPFPFVPEVRQRSELGSTKAGGVGRRLRARSSAVSRTRAVRADPSPPPRSGRGRSASGNGRECRYRARHGRDPSSR
jgi:hypothetical protein